MRNNLSTDAMLLLAVVAIIVAFTIFAGYSYIQSNRTAVAESDGRQQTGVSVQGEIITITYDPNQLVNIVPIVADGGQQPVLPEPTQQPQEAQPEPTQQPQEAQPEPTQPPQEIQPLPTQAPQATAVPTQAPQPVAPATGGASGVEPIIFINYTVVQGDTLFGLTQKQITSITLMAENGVAQDHLVPGTTISLPVANPSYCTGGTTPYVIKEGDTAFSIASRNGITTELLQQYNSSTVPNLAEIDAGNVLCV